MKIKKLKKLSWMDGREQIGLFSSVQLLSHVRLFVTLWIAACQASLSITNSRSSFKLMSIESVMPSSHLILCSPLLLLPPIPPSIRAFSNESTLRMEYYSTIKKECIWVSSNEVDEPRAYYTEWSQSERERGFYPTMKWQLHLAEIS